METKAIVILYEGSTPTRGTIKEMLECASFIADKSTVKVETLGFQKLCGILANSVKAPVKVVTEDGDSAVIYLAGKCRDITNVGKLATDIIKGLNAFSQTDNVCDEAFVRACSLLAQESAVSVSVAKKYGFTSATRDIITQLYRAWKDHE